MLAEAELTWFFGVAQTYFSRSSEGARLDIAEQYAYTSSGSRVASRAEHRALVSEARTSGAGYDEDYSLDAQPATAQHRGEASYEPNHALLSRFARVSRALRACTPTQALALAAYYGDDGQRLACSLPLLGALGAVMPHTPAGRRIVAKATERAPLRPRRPLAAVLGELTLSRHGCLPEERKRRLSAAESQARALYHEAVSVVGRAL